MNKYDELWVIKDRLSAGVPAEQVAAKAGLELGTIDGRPAVVLPGWVAVDDAVDPHGRYYACAASAKEAADAYIMDTDYEPRDWVYVVYVRCYRLAVALDEHGRPICGMADCSEESVGQLFSVEHYDS